MNCEVDKGLRLINTCFQKRKSRLITFRSGETETMIDYILVNKRYRSSVKDVKVRSQFADTLLLSDEGLCVVR